MAEKNQMMDPLYEVHALAGETLALQAVLFGVLPRLAALSPEIKAALSAGLDDAPTWLSKSRSSMGTKRSPRTQPRRYRSSKAFDPTPSRGPSCKCKIRVMMAGPVINKYEFEGNNGMCVRYAARLRS